MKTNLFAVVVLMLGSTVAVTDEMKALVGRQFMPKENCRVMNGERFVDERWVTLPMTVIEVRDGWLNIGPGYVRLADVVAYEEAAEYYTAVLAKNPNSDRVYNQRAAIYHKQGRLAEAVADYTASIRLGSRNATAYTNRASALSSMGEHKRAVADYQAVLLLDPQSAWGYNGLAWIKATCPNEEFREGARAVELAKEACRLSNNNPYCLSTLAAASAEVGNFADAVKYQQQAIDAHQSPDPADFERTLRHYVAGRPYRDVAGAAKKNAYSSASR